MKHPAAPLDEIVTIVGGGTPSTNRREYFRGRIPWVSPKDMKCWDIVDSIDHVTEEAIANSSTTLIARDAVLVVIRSGVLKHTLPVAINRVPVTINQDMKALICGDRVIPDYLARALQALSSRLLQTVRGTTADNISTDVLRGLEVPLPTLPEQGQIARRLEQADRLRHASRYALALTDTFLPAAFRRFFGDARANSKKWESVTLGEVVVRGPQNGIYKPASAYGAGTPILRIDAFYDGAVTEISSLKRVRLVSDDIECFGLSENDIVVNRVNSRPYLGKSALIPKLNEPTVFESNMMRLTLNTKSAAPVYVTHYLQTSFVKSQIQVLAKDAVNQSSINQEDVKGLIVRLPPIALQQKFAALVERVERLRAVQRESLCQAEHLFASLLHRAFSG